MRIFFINAAAAADCYCCHWRCRCCYPPRADLDFLVALQAFLTVVGNCTCWWAAWRIYDAAQAEKAAGSS
jgi:hypothetical protein